MVHNLWQRKRKLVLALLYPDEDIVAKRNRIVWTLLYSLAQSPRHMSYLVSPTWWTEHWKAWLLVPTSISIVSWPSSLNPDLVGYITNMILDQEKKWMWSISPSGARNVDRRQAGVSKLLPNEQREVIWACPLCSTNNFQTRYSFEGIHKSWQQGSRDPSIPGNRGNFFFPWNSILNP